MASLVVRNSLAAISARRSATKKVNVTIQTKLAVDRNVENRDNIVLTDACKPAILTRTALMSLVKLRSEFSASVSTDGC